MEHKRGCIARTPFASLIATIMCIIGLAVFLGTMYTSIEGTNDLTFQHFDARISWVDTVKIVLLVFGASTGLVAIFLLILGFLSTGATREKVYSGNSSRVGGRICLGFFLVFTYIISFVWIVVASLLCIGMVMMLILWGYCRQEALNNQGGLYDCLDLSAWNFLFPELNMGSLCENSLQNFCKKTNELYPLYIVAYISAAVVLMSLITYLVCLATNYTRVKEVEKAREFEELRYMEASEMRAVSSNVD